MFELTVSDNLTDLIESNRNELLMLDEILNSNSIDRFESSHEVAVGLCGKTVSQLNDSELNLLQWACDYNRITRFVRIARDYAEKTRDALDALDTATNESLAEARRAKAS